MIETPARTGKRYMEDARDYLAEGDRKRAIAHMRHAVRMRPWVEQYDPRREQPGLSDGEVLEMVRGERIVFGNVLRRAFVLADKLGYHKYADQIYHRACEWSKDQNCSSPSLRNEIEHDWQRVRSHSILRRLVRLTLMPLRLLGHYEIGKMQGT